MQFTKNFSLAEMTKSQSAIRLGLKNEPGAAAIENLRYLCRNVLQPLRDAVGPIFVSSGFRSHGLNRMIGGARTSQHVLGQAADIEGQISNVELARAIIKLKLPFDQLILEFYDGENPNSGWVHVSHRPEGRREVLTATRIDGKTVYKKGLPEVSDELAA